MEAPNLYKYLPNSPIRQTQLNCVSTKYLQVSAHQSQLNCGDTKYVQVPVHLANLPITIKLWDTEYVQRVSAHPANLSITIKLWNESPLDRAARLVPAWTHHDGFINNCQSQMHLSASVGRFYLYSFFCTYPLCSSAARYLRDPKIGWFKSAALPATPIDAIYSAIL